MKKNAHQPWSRRFLFGAFILFFILIVGAGSAGARQGSNDLPPGITNGQSAVDALGERLPDVAAEYGMSAEELERLFLTDHTLHVGRGGELFYIDEKFPGDDLASQQARVGPAVAPFPDDQTFLLHSRPGADHTIYLDFDGHVTTGTSWNSGYGVPTINSPAYDIDSNPGSFNSTEIERIQKTWQIVSEDFRPFDINVTTQDPGPDALRYSGGGDTQWGTRVVITDDTFANCGCGGHAYVGSFDDSQDEPVFVYNTSLTGVAEASTHEVGHALLLAHDGLASGTTYYQGHGSGETSWAPIMGVGYYVNISHWSKGDYYDSNNNGASANYGNGPDDLAVIADLGNGNGFGYRPDDHGNSDGSASALNVSVGVVSDMGFIERTTDVDVFSFTTGAGQINLSIDPYTPGPNLDVLATLYDAGGGLIATSDSASLLDATINPTLAAGTYYLRIDGTGTGDPFSSTPTGYVEYGSLGEYAISGTIVDPGGNHAPLFSSDPVVEANANEDAAYTGSTLADDASDPDGDPLTFNKLSGPSWLQVAANGTLSGTPVNSNVGLNSWTVMVSDDQGGSSQATLQITVINTNDPPAFDSDPIVEANGTEGSAYSGSLADDASDPDGDSLTFSKTGGPAWLDVAGDGTLSGTPTNGDVGLNTFNVEVADGNGGTATASLQITVEDLPDFVDYTAIGETFVAGSVSGTFADTHTDDDVYQSIEERESGGKPANRHTWLEHKWTFNIPAGGTSTTFYAQAWAQASSEGDFFRFSYSTNDSTYVEMFEVAASDDDNTYQPFDLTGLSGTLYIKVEDADRTSGNKNKETVFVDHLYIRTDNTPAVPPAAPSGLSATAVSASQIDLIWSDHSDNEIGFYIERSPDGLSGWERVGSTGPEATSFSDTGLNSETTYYYQVQAYNSADGSGYTNVANDTTFVSTITYMRVSALTPSSEAVRNKWNATVQILVTTDGVTPVANATVSGDWSAGATGSAGCTTEADGTCTVKKNNLKSNVSSVTFTVTGAAHATYTFDLANSVTVVTVQK